ncbi:biotin protein ligase, putative [Entamoeba invadens IP1]|uniref:Biotin protein ligase, putative n=1 Tax=Entamoeba invadens IP1 TaxID=370355 RepID=A0A0A1TV71_ENTIV|nr:biotin protein ligase, putative [Entamoeba invadens IP1]ELP84239.1 biotin protein ligase, putative [Entamoeba invadens IP1]|eukprot:XP_004183585.1 biotin protein ligase, putative [Entamoeba invadens IP1]
MSKWYIVDTCESTMDLANQLWTQKEYGDGWIVQTKVQTKGRGREERVWISGEEDLMFTLMVEVKEEKVLRKIGISALVSMVQTLQDVYQIEVKGKWPNDGFINNKKLFGILVEANYIENSFHVNIGIGLNLKRKGIDTAISLEEVGIVTFNTKDIVEIFRNTFYRNLHLEDEELMNQFKIVDMLYGKVVNICSAKDTEKKSLECGKVVGYTQDWKIILESETNGNIQLKEFDREEVIL